jgi:hypothetical protein
MAMPSLTLLVQALPTLSATAPFWRMGYSLTATFWLALAGGLVLQALALYWPPLASILLTEPLSGADLTRVLGLSLVALAVVETGKVLAVRHRGESGPRPDSHASGNQHGRREDQQPARRMREAVSMSSRGAERPA